MNTEPTPKKNKPNMLNDQERFSLWNAMNSMKDRIESEKWTYDRLMEEFKKTLKFEITLGNLRKATEITGVKVHRDIKANKYRGHRLAEAEKRIEELEKLVLEQYQKIQDHEEAIVRMLSRMEETCKKVNEFVSRTYRLENGRLVTVNK